MDIEEQLEELHSEAQECALEVFMLFLTTPKYLNNPNTMFKVVTTMAYDVFLGSVAPLLDKEQEEDIWRLFVEIALSTRELPFKQGKGRQAAEMLSKLVTEEGRHKLLPGKDAAQCFDDVKAILKDSNVITTLLALMVASGAFSIPLYDTQTEYEGDLNDQFLRYRKFKRELEAQNDDTRH